MLALVGMFEGQKLSARVAAWPFRLVRGESLFTSSCRRLPWETCAALRRTAVAGPGLGVQGCHGTTVLDFALAVEWAGGLPCATDGVGWATIESRKAAVHKTKFFFFERSILCLPSGT